uniref:Uncharacterized protein n=1 Tax=Nelumbo nucifera TaxID=4432 RepID=A0A822YC50_NELNU|nr:TPA_asm: hypothetical protein HUJ06_010545 [Nelumbo nucifera]
MWWEGFNNPLITFSCLSLERNQTIKDLLQVSYPYNQKFLKKLNSLKGKYSFTNSTFCLQCS